MKGRVAVVTGGASGIGLAIASACARRGAKVVIADVDPKAGQEAAVSVGSVGVSTTFVQTDVASQEECRRLIETAEQKYGGVDILVNSAGLQHIAPLVDFPEERWNYLLAVILTGTFLCTKYAVPHMIRQGWGRVVNIASLHAKVASPLKSAYVAAKHGVLGFTKVAALELGEKNITVNAICPAYVRTPLVEKQIAEQARQHGIPPQDVVRRIMTEPAAIRRLLEPEEVASLAVYLASDEAAGITGAAIDIDLGWTAR
jgi:3-hydroxybutyrate dehydrogenase